MVDARTLPRPTDLRGPLRYLWWLVVRQRWRVAAGATLGTTWMVALAVPPYLMSRAIDDGLRPRHTGALLTWVAALVGNGVLIAVVGGLRHRTMTKIRMDASFRTVRAVVWQATRLGAGLSRRVTAGEVATIGMSDVRQVAEALTITGPGVGAVVAYATVAVVLRSISPLLAAVVLAGVPLLAVAVGPLLHRLQHRGTGYRARQGELTARLVDVVTGLRVLSGLGGKERYAQRFRRDSARLCAEGYRVGAVTSWVEALGAGLPGLFLAAVTWLAARMAVAGTITVGDLVAVYGYVAILVVPVAFFIEGGAQLIRASVAARRVIRLLSLSPDDAGRPRADPGPSGPAALYDPASGVRVEPGRLTAVVAARPGEAAALVDRLGGFTLSDVTWGGRRLDAVAPRTLRDRILVADNEADLFAGTLREVVAGRAEPDDDRVRTALWTAAAQDVLDGLPGGLAGEVTAQGGNLSGGQRQRVRLARAVYAAPEVLLAVEPTSAVDAHTEALMASRLRTARDGLTTVLTTTSPLVLDRADEVVYLVDGWVAATGTHHDLLRAEPGYRELVSRGAADEEVVR